MNDEKKTETTEPEAKPYDFNATAREAARRRAEGAFLDRYAYDGDDRLG
jgi:hypothetical protein